MPRHRALLALSALCTVAFLAWVLWFCRFGVDFRDEGYYLVWMADPFKYDVSITQFGFIYHPLFELVGRDIVAARRINLLITFGLAWMLSNMVLQHTGGLSARPVARRAMGAAVACTSLSFLHTWLPTPSYNWLTLQALMLAAIGMLQVLRAPIRGGWTGWLLVGVAGWLTFMAKPTSAALLGLVACAYLAICGRLRWQPMLLGAGCALLLLLASAFWIDGSVERFIQRYRIGINFAELMGGGHKLSLFLRLGDLQLDPFILYSLTGGTALLLLLIGLAGAASRWWRRAAAISGLLFALGALVIVAGHAKHLMPIEYHKGLLPAVIPLAALLAFILRGPRRWATTDRSRWALIALLLLLPYVYVFGTVNNYWWQISQATFFWVLAGALLISSPAAESRSIPEAVLPVLILVLASQLVIATIVQTGIEAPYGQPGPLRDQHRKVSIGAPPSSLRLSPGFGDYLEQSIEVSRAAGFKPGTPVLDLTGRSPTTLYAMGATSTSQAWMIGGYPGSDALARAYIARASCEELARAWVLIQPQGTTNLSPTLLNTFGAELDRDYERVGTIVMDQRFSGYRELWTQYLLKPRRSPNAAREACFTARSTQP